MLTRYNAIDIEDALRAATPPPPFPPARDRAAWSAIRRQLGKEEVQAILRQAEEDARTPIPALPASLYLEFKREGRREGYQQPRSQRRELLRNLALAECLAGEGRFLDPILDLAWAICEESSWALPAHQVELADMQRPVIDLGAAMTALELAELDLLLGDQLDPRLGKRIRDEVDRRCLTPYLTRHDFWWLHNSNRRSVNNWTAVCNGGVAGAALYLEPNPARLAEILARAARSLDDYLDTFDPDGGSSEGPGYWDYGFGYYTVLAHLVEQRTEGRIDFLRGERMRQIASYPMRTVLSRGAYVNFSDCRSNITYSRAHLAFLAQRLELPELASLAWEQPSQHRRANLTWGLRSLFWQPPADVPHAFTPSRHDWFSGMMWMIARYDPADPQALVLAAKGGHNQEMHNQNDVGNIIVHVGGESVIADIGQGRYTRAYFGPERYEHLVNSSLGHSVPVVNGQLQAPGRQHAAQLLEHVASDRQDTLALELKDAYPEAAGLASLRRRVTLHREAPRGWVELEDAVEFAEAPGDFETALTTFGRVELGEDALILYGLRGKLRVAFDANLVTARMDLFEGVELSTGPADVRRVAFALKEPAYAATIRLEIVPI